MIRRAYQKKSMLISKMDSLDEEESNIAKKAKDAFQEASLETLNFGQSILRVDGNIIYEVLPNGEKIKVKSKKNSIRVTSRRVTLR